MNNMPITYLIASAMRGPDVERYLTDEIEDLWTNLKYHLTARLRAMYFEESECLGVYNANYMSEGDLKSVIQWANKLCDLEQPQLSHYLLHISDALLQINRMGPVLETDLFGGYLLPLREEILKIVNRISMAKFCKAYAKVQVASHN